MAVEDTFVMVKPDGVRRGLVGEVVARMERKGLKLEHIRQLVISEDTAGRHYAEHTEKPFYPDLARVHHQRAGRGHVVVGGVGRVGRPHADGSD